MRRNFKKLIFFGMLFIFLFEANFAFALEVQYPKIPGALTPQEIREKVKNKEIEPDRAFPLYLNYFLRLFFFLVLIVIIGVLIGGGILYLFSSGRPNLAILAKEKISSALLGLVILLTSYLILGIVNPQLLVFRVSKEKLPVIVGPPSLITKDKVVYQEVPLGVIIDNILNLIEEKAKEPAEFDEDGNPKKDRDGNIIWKTPQISDEYGENRTLSAIEYVFYKAKKLSKEFNDKVKELQDLMEKCKCGKAKVWPKYKFKVDWKTRSFGMECKCLPGSENALSSARCEDFCDDCGQKKDNQGNSLCNQDAIKQKKDEVLEIAAKLKNLQLELAKELKLFEEYLKIFRGGVLVQNTKLGLFSEDFSAFKKSLRKSGYSLKVEKVEDFPESKIKKIVPGFAKEPTIFQKILSYLGFSKVEGQTLQFFKIEDPLTFRFPIVLPWAKEVGQRNKQLVADLERYNFLYILTQITPAEFHALLNSCVESAFGNLKLKDDIPEKKMREIINNGLKDALGKLALESFFSKKGDLIVAFKKKIIKETDEKLLRCDEIRKKYPRFLSDKLAKFLSTPIEKQLPESLSLAIKSSVEKNILSKKTSELLSTSTYQVLPESIKTFLTTSLENLSPEISKALNKRVVTLLPDSWERYAQRVNKFLGDALPAIEEKIKLEAVIRLNKLLARFKNTIQDKTELVKKGIEDPDFGSLEKAWKELEIKDAGFTTKLKYQTKKLPKKLAIGGLNYLSSLTAAIFEVSAYTLGNYIVVWLEDEVLTPLHPYLVQLKNLQKRLQKVFKMTIKDVLPKTIQKTLEKNMLTILDDYCKRDDADVDKDGLCTLNDFLKKPVRENLASSMAEILEKEVKELLPQKIQKFLRKNPAQIFFGDKVKDPEKIVKATPKQILCGEVSLGGKLLAEKCREVVELYNEGGPSLKIKENELSQACLGQEDFCRQVCPTIVGLCQIPLKNYFPYLTAPLGKVLEDSLLKLTSCKEIKFEKEGEIWKCPAGTDEKKCKQCITIFKRGIGYHLFYQILGQLDKKKQEQVIKFLLIVFGDLIKVPLKEAAIDNGIGEDKFDEIADKARQERAKIENPEECLKNPEDCGVENQVLNFLAEFYEAEFYGKSLWRILTCFNLGVKEVLTGEEVNLERCLQNRGPRNWLAWTPGEFINAFCNKIDEIVKTNPSPPERIKKAQKICQRARIILPKTPAQILGWDKRLIEYLAPEYEILFFLIKTQLLPEEKPPVLDKGIDFLYENTPVSVIAKAGRILRNIGEEGLRVVNMENIGEYCEPTTDPEGCQEKTRGSFFHFYTRGYCCPTLFTKIEGNCTKTPPQQGVKLNLYPDLIYIKIGAKFSTKLKIKYQGEDWWCELQPTNEELAKIICPEVDKCYSISANPADLGEGLEKLAKILDTPFGKYLKEFLGIKDFAHLFFGEEINEVISFGKYLEKLKDKLDLEELKKRLKILGFILGLNFSNLTEILKASLLEILAQRGHQALARALSRTFAGNLSNIPFFAQPLLDTVGHWLDLDILACKATMEKAEIDKRINNAVLAFQDKAKMITDEMFRYKPAKFYSLFTSYISKKLGIGAGESINEKFFKEACKEKTGKDCGSGEITVEKEGKDYCCSYGKRSVCFEIKNTSQECEQEGGVVQHRNGKAFCCTTLIDCLARRIQRLIEGALNDALLNGPAFRSFKELIKTGK